MTVRVQVILERSERERFRRRAAEEGLSLSAWLRQAGRDREAAREARRKWTESDLRTFFRQVRARERSREPDWEEHAEVIRRSIARGQSET